MHIDRVLQMLLMEAAGIGELTQDHPNGNQTHHPASLSLKLC